MNKCVVSDKSVHAGKIQEKKMNVHARLLDTSEYGRKDVEILL